MRHFSVNKYKNVLVRGCACLYSQCVSWACLYVAVFVAAKCAEMPKQEFFFFLSNTRMPDALWMTWKNTLKSSQENAQNTVDAP